MLTIKNLHVSYGSITALQGILLTVPEGQIVAVRAVAGIGAIGRASGL